MFICLYFTRRDLNTKKIRQSKGSLSTMYQIIEKLSMVFSKESDMSWITLWLSFSSGVNRRASCILSHYWTKTVYLFVNTFYSRWLLSAEFHNSRVNVKGGAFQGPVLVLGATRLMKSYTEDSSNSLDSNRDRVAFTIFLVDLISITRK